MTETHVQETMKAGDLEPDIEHKKELSELRFLEMLKSKAHGGHGAVKSMPIFREDKGADFMLVTPGEKETRSAFWVDKLIKNMQSWSRFPSRTRFISGFTSIGAVGGAAEDQYVVIPLDNSRVGICPTASFYRSFSAVERGMQINRVDNDSLALWATTLAKGVQEVTDSFTGTIESPKTFSEFQKLLKQVDKQLTGKQNVLRKKVQDARGLEDTEKLVITDLLDRHVSTCETYLSEKLDPETNGFQATRVESMATRSEVTAVWIADPVLLVRRSKYIELHERGDIK